MKIKIVLLLLSMGIGSVSLPAQADMNVIVDMIKTNLLASSENIKSFEWVQTVSSYYKGELKTKKQYKCYYSPDGTLTKVAMGASNPSAKTTGGQQGQVAENKKDDINAYTEAALKRVEAYLPPDPNKIQAISIAGKATVGVLEPGKQYKLDFPDYLEPGDLLSFSLDIEKKLIMALAVNTYVENPSDNVKLDVKYVTVPGGTQYSGTTILDAPAKGVKVLMINSGFKKSAGH